jgi:chaperonin cofactor prefoldin
MDKEFKKKLSKVMSREKIIKHQQILIDMLIEKKDQAEFERSDIVDFLNELKLFTSDKDIYQPINNLLNEYLNK